MNALRQLITKAMDEGQKSLSEADSKRILSAYGVPVVSEIVAKTSAEAVVAASKLGFPVVVKGLGSKLTHKTELGVVRLNLADAEEVSRATEDIAARAKDALEGFLVQPMLKGRREFVAGFFRDAIFGPVVMFGLGGVFTEALKDVSFRVAPLGQPEAEGMLEEIRSKALLGAFRGEAAANKENLMAALFGLSKLALDFPEIAEVDINPLLVSPDGSVAAVDALIVLGKPKTNGVSRIKVDPKRIRDLFYPKSVAFIGASNQFNKWGHMLLSNTIGQKFEGDIYLVNSKGEPIAGRPVYRSILDVPGPVDLAVVTVPAKYVLDLLPQLQQKGIKSMLLITSGFSETGPEGVELENRLAEEARKAGVLILGPNTMGIVNPHAKFFCTGAQTWPKPGETALVAQSGNMGVQLLAFAEQQGIGIRGFCGSGNEAMITIEDFLEGFEVDDVTKTVVLYIESVKDGRRFFESARRLGTKKPVVVLKGGRTEEGSKAAASHTGAMAADNKVFSAACRQAGIILVNNPMDLLDLSAALASVPLPKGPRTAIMTLGGGWGVVTADLCADNGLSISKLDQAVIQEIDKHLPPYWSRANPIDLVGENDTLLPFTVMELLAQWDGCDAIINLGIIGRGAFLTRLLESCRRANPTYPESFYEALTIQYAAFEENYNQHIVRLMEKYGKPIVGVSLITDESSKTLIPVEGSQYKGAYFQTPERAVKALAHIWEYSRWLKEQGFSR